ncbi:MAG: hypothetical protein ACRENP_15245 [Longimicrobiales bacterium]
MSYRPIVRTSFALIVLATAGLIGPRQAHAQNASKAQNVIKARLHSVQLAFGKKLANDQTFTQQFNHAVQSSNVDAAAALVSAATGFTRARVRVSVNGTKDELEMAGLPNQTAEPFRFASAEHAQAMLTITVCMGQFYWWWCWTF